MASETVIAQIEETVPALTDIIYAVGDPGGVPVNNKWTRRTTKNHNVFRTAIDINPLDPNLHEEVRVDSSGAPRTMTLPAAPVDGTIFWITDIGNATTNNITIQRGGADTINGGTSIILTTNFDGVALMYGATEADWFAIQVTGGATGPAGGDLTGTYPNPTVDVSKITYAKIQKVAADNRVLGNVLGATQDVQELTPDNMRTIMNLATTDATFLGRIRTVDGTIALPSYSFTSDTASGMYSSGSSQIGFSAGGIEVCRMFGTHFQTNVSIRNGLGAVGLPSYSFTALNNAGMWSDLGAGDVVAFSVAGAKIGGFRTNQFRMNLDGSAGTPAVGRVQPTNSFGSGMYWSEGAGLTSCHISVNGINHTQFYSLTGSPWTSARAGLIAPAGGSIFPGLTTSGATGGFYTQATNLSFAAGGVEHFRYSTAGQKAIQRLTVFEKVFTVLSMSVGTNWIAFNSSATITVVGSDEIRAHQSILGMSVAGTQTGELTNYFAQQNPVTTGTIAKSQNFKSFVFGSTSTGAITDFAGYRSVNGYGSLTIADAHEIHIQPPTGTAVANMWGIRIGDVSIGTSNNYAIALDGDGIGNGVWWGAGQNAVAYYSTDFFIKADQVGTGDIILDSDVEHRGTNLGFYTTTPIPQEADIVALTDSTGGTANNTVVAVPAINGSGATTAQEAAINDNFADLAAKVNAIRTVLRNYGLMA